MKDKGLLQQDEMDEEAGEEAMEPTETEAAEEAAGPEESEAEEAAGGETEAEGEDDGDGEGRGLTEEQKQVANEAIDSATKFLYENKKVRDVVVKMITPPPHTKAIGDAAAMIVKQTSDSMKGRMPTELVGSLLLLMVKEIITIGEELNLFEGSEEFARDAMIAAGDAAGPMFGIKESPGEPPQMGPAAPQGQPPAPTAAPPAQPGLME